MKILAAAIFLFSYLKSIGQDPSSNQNIIANDQTSFRLSFTTFNHAGRIMYGTTTYKLTESYIKVIKVYLFDTTGTTVFSKPLKNKKTLVSNFNNIRLDSLKEFYFNFCVMASSGNEYFLDYSSESTTKKIHLHHYYLKELDEIIKIINSYLPKRYQLHYLLENTQQDCRLSDLLDL